MSNFVNLQSVWRGIRAMRQSEAEQPARWAIQLQRPPLRFWIHAWTPVWHEGRGPYITIGLGLVAIFRGY